MIGGVAPSEYLGKLETGDETTPPIDRERLPLDPRRIGGGCGGTEDVTFILGILTNRKIDPSQESACWVAIALFRT